jgi:hypothetical protein
MSLADPIAAVLHEFESAFSRPTWSKVQVLIVGTLFAHGRRTVAAALRLLGVHDAPHFSLYHHVLNRARWSALELSRRLLHLLVRTFVAVGGELRSHFKTYRSEYDKAMCCQAKREGSPWRGEN